MGCSNDSIREDIRKLQKRIDNIDIRMKNLESKDYNKDKKNDKLSIKTKNETRDPTKKIINIRFKIDNKQTILAQAYPSDRLGDLFDRALAKNNIDLIWKNNYTFCIYGTNYITSSFTSNEQFSSLNLSGDDFIINVYS